MRNVFVKPAAAGAIIRDPGTQIALAASGEWKPANSFWLRRIAQNDVVDATKAQETLQADLGAAKAANAKIASDLAPAKSSKGGAS